MSKNFSRSTTADTANNPFIEQRARSRKRLQITFLLLLAVVTALSSITGCAQGPESTYHTPTLLNASSSLESNSGSSDPQQDTTLRETRPLYTYMAQQEIKPVTPPADVLATGVIKLNPNRLVTVSGTIQEQMLPLANQLIGLANSSRSDIDIVISSPGGYISHGLYFIQAMREVKSKGIKIRCHVPILAASMAYVIFTQCDERYALPYAQLLFHAPRVSGKFTITPPVAIRLAKDLLHLEATLANLMLPIMGVPAEGSEWFVQNYLEERLFLATELVKESPVAWLKLVGKINNYPGDFPPPYSGFGALNAQTLDTEEPSKETAQ